MLSFFWNKFLAALPDLGSLLKHSKDMDEVTYSLKTPSTAASKLSHLDLAALFTNLITFFSLSLGRFSNSLIYSVVVR